MEFNFSAGLSEAGKVISTTAAAYTLEAQRADLEQQKIKLADELAGAREEKQRGFLTSERVEGQKFQSGEKGLDRSHAEKLANLQAETALKSAGISAGASKYAADLGASERQKDREQNAPLVAQETIARHIKNQAETSVLDARKELQQARESGDPARIRAAQQKEYDATYTSQTQVQQVSLFQAQAKAAAQDREFVQGKITALQLSSQAMMPETQAAIKQLQTQLKQRESEYQTYSRMAADALKDLPSYNPGGSTAGDGVIQYDAEGKRVVTPTAPTPAAPTGLKLPPKSPGMIDTAPPAFMGVP